MSGPGREPAPDVSVVIPTFHRERQLGEAVQSALGQAGVTVEVIVVDDSAEGSARGVVDAFADPRVRYVARAAPSGGNPGVVRNAGLGLARAAYVNFLDDDDQLADGALAALRDALARTPRAGVAVGVVQPFGPDAAALAREEAYFARAAARLRGCRGRYDAIALLLFADAPVINSGVMIRSALARSLGGYDARISHCEDAAFFARAIRRSDFVFVDRPVVRYRTGGPSRMHAPGATPQVAGAYQLIHQIYGATYGTLELYALKLLAFTMR
jgi:glycosyltransferase involved in cell wall biosynthesis